MTAKTNNRFSIITRCVDCSHEGMTYSNNFFSCGNCSRKYIFDEHNILHAFPSKPKALPLFYQSDVFLRWIKVWNMDMQDWVIYSNPIYRWFSMVGHRHMDKSISLHCAGSDFIVDFGCGGGQFFSLQSNHEQCIGVDSNIHFLRLLKKKYPDVLAVHGDFQNSPFGSKLIKCIASLHTLEHLYFLAESLEEIQRTLSEDGRFYFCIPTEGGFGWKLGRRLVTKPYLRKKYNLDVNEVMAIEHINDARRIIKFLELYFKLDSLTYLPFSFLPILSVNSCTCGIATPK